MIKVADPFFVNLNDMQTQRDTSLQNCECQNDNMGIFSRDVSNRSGSSQVLAKQFPGFLTGIQNMHFVRNDNLLRSETAHYKI